MATDYESRQSDESLAYTQTPKFKERMKVWDEAFLPFEEGTKDSGIVSEKDLAITINVRDNE